MPRAGRRSPSPGGASAFARRAFNDLVGFIAGWATVLDFVLAISLSALFLPYYFAGALGQYGWFHGQPGRATVVAVAIVLVVTVIRMLRRTDAYTIGVVVAALDLVVQVGIAIFGLMLLFSVDALKNSIDLGTVPTWNSVAFALPIAMIGYTGLEKVGSLAGVAKNPEKTPSRQRSHLGVHGRDRLQRGRDRGRVGVPRRIRTEQARRHDAPRARSGWTRRCSAWRTRSARRARTGSRPPFASASGSPPARSSSWPSPPASRAARGSAEAMGRHTQLPPVFGRTSRRVLAPPAAIISVSVLAIGFLVVGSLYSDEETLTLASLYSFGILIAFMLTQAAIIWLRISEPDLPRPFMMKGNVWISGRLIPVTSVVGVVLSFAAWVVALGTHPGARVVGPLWMIGGLVIYAGTRIRAGLPLIERVEDAAPPPADVTDIAFSTVVVPLERLDAIAEETMATACRLAAEAGAAVVGVSAIYVPVRDPPRQGHA